jgi:hypothetical protein
MMAYQVQVTVTSYRRRKPIKSSAYLRFVRSLPCCACGSTRYVEAMHVGPRGMSQKVDDKDALPGCRFCHKELHQIGPVEFQQKYSLDFETEIEKLNTFYESNLRGTY